MGRKYFVKLPVQSAEDRENKPQLVTIFTTQAYPDVGGICRVGLEQTGQLLSLSSHLSTFLSVGPCIPKTSEDLGAGDCHHAAVCPPEWAARVSYRQ